MQLFVFGLAIASYGLASAYPFNPFAGGMSFAGPFSGAYAGPFAGAGAGAFAGAGTGAYTGAGSVGFWPFGGWFDPVFRFPFVWPVMRKPWYEGENVCPQTKVSKEPDEIQEFLKDTDSDFSAGDFEHQSKWCRGGNTKYMCMERTSTNEGSKMIVTKYECCHGFVRPEDGAPGCVETSPGATSSPPSVLESPSSSGVSRVRMQNQMRYNYLPSGGVSSSSSSSSTSGSTKKSGVESVAAQ